MHHLACHHWSNFFKKLTIFWEVLAKKLPQSILKWAILEKNPNREG